MTPAEHYEYAETLLEMASDAELGGKHERYLIKKAQVHATLAAAGHARDDGSPSGCGDPRVEAGDRPARTAPVTPLIDQVCALRKVDAAFPGLTVWQKWLLINTLAARPCKAGA